MPPLSKVTVLILDDNPLVLKLGRALLEREGCTVLTASSWIEFNHVLAGNTPDIIFLDVNLPSIKGNRLSEVLKSQSNKKDIPIVLISDLPEKSLEEMFPSSGANAWMRKPLTRDKMVDMISTLRRQCGIWCNPAGPMPTGPLPVGVPRRFAAESERRSEHCNDCSNVICHFSPAALPRDCGRFCTVVFVGRRCP